MEAKLAERVFRAYRAGLLRPRPSLHGRDGLFDVLFRQVYWLKVPLRERLPISRIWELSSGGLRLARQGRLDEAAQAFDACWEGVERAGLSPGSELLTRTFVESCHAYFEHKRGDFERARERTFDSMEADRRLAEDDDWSLLELHRVQSANNLMRIDLRRGDAPRALALAGEILAYLEGFRGGLSVHHGWRADHLRGLTPRAIRCALIAQVGNEAALALAAHTGRAAGEAFFAGVGLEDFLAAPGALHPHFRQWLLTREAWERREEGVYLERLAQFLALGRADVPPLWYTALLDFLAWCREVDTRVSRFVHDGMAREAAKWPGVPAALRPALGLERGEEETRGRPSAQAAGFGPARAAAA